MQCGSFILFFPHELSSGLVLVPSSYVASLADAHFVSRSIVVGVWTIVRLLDLGGIILGFLTAAAVPSEAMTSRYLRPPRRYLGRAPSEGPNVFSQSFYGENVGLDDKADRTGNEEDQILLVLLEAFPGVCLESLSAAYARADKDPNLAAEILAMETTDKMEAFAQSSEVAEKRREPADTKSDIPFLEEEFDTEGNFTEAIPKVIHLDDFRSEGGNSNQLKNGHGDFAGASVWRDSPILGSQTTLAESSSGSAVASKSSKLNPPDNGAYLVLSETNAIGTSKLSAKAEVYEYKGSPSTRISSFSGGSNPPKLSAVTGSVSNQMQRRASDTSGIGTGAPGQREMELDDGLYSGKLEKNKTKRKDGNAAEDLGPEDIVRLRAAEDFLHSMLGGEFGIDLIRDILGHYAGDTDKALETLLNIGLPSSRIHYCSEAEKVINPLSSIGDQEDCLGDIKQTTRAFLENGVDIETDEVGPYLSTDQKESDKEVFGEDGQSNKDVLIMLCMSFPTVPESFLGNILQVARFSYGGAVEILRDAGMIPVDQQTKMDAGEVLQALFKTESESLTAAGPSYGPLVTAESWSTVAAKPRVRRSPDLEDKSTSSGKWNEYARHRASANEHWETMKMYMKEATAAYNRGDRYRAGLLSEKGAKFKQLAQEASKRASENIFNVKNKDIENNITIDLHSQHVTESLRLLELHLRTLSQVPSVDVLTVITGQGSHSTGGRAKIKPAVMKYLDKRQIPWTEVNAGCIIIKMTDIRGMDGCQKDSDSSSGNESY